ncbi:MAG: erythromycin esterase family protein [Acidobacteria bacterium]|jgi:erythromycin esterase-like protein|nr:erythromycin esterase family protein [Acidobacteriota bacterium]
MNILADEIREKAIAFDGANDVADEILALIGDARFVLIGEASHGTHEFYKYRAEITKRLIEEKNFSAVAVEADFPDAYRVNRYVRGSGKDQTANDALSDFTRFPLWMWRNADVLDFVGWLRAHNDKLNATQRIGFYGIDLYSLHASMEAVLDYLEKIDPQAAQQARYRYSCFDHFGEDAQQYGYAASYNLTNSCETEVVNQLIELRRRAADYMNRDGFVARDEYFFAEQNARLVKNAEEYYRSMFHGRVSSWNLRDRHMAETLSALAAHLETQGQAPKIVVWAHNSHLGDARATEMGKRGEWNVGQLVREKYGNEAILIGFTTHAGTVTATTNWDEPAKLKKVRPSHKNSYEQIFHKTGLPQFFLNLRDKETEEILRRPQLERAIGVIYRPETERVSHYFTAVLSEQFDGVIHFDETRAVEPLDKTASWTHEDLPETFPVGI